MNPRASLARRVCEEGAKYASTAELIAVITGRAVESAAELGDCDLLELGKRIENDPAGLGLPSGQAARLCAALELGARVMLNMRAKKDSIRHAKDAVEHFGDLVNAEQEEVRVLFLTTRNRPIGSAMVARGSLNCVSLRLADVFREAVRRNARSIIVAHNHPGGDPSPSPEDINITREIIKAGQLLGVDVLDHLIVASLASCCSLREAGYAFA